VFQITHYVAPLSILGSSAIIYRILKFDRHELDANNRRTYHRLLVAMSTCDIFGSLAYAFGPTPVPKDTLLETARGNTATCTAQGFFIHIFVLPVLYYNTGLMIYFLLTIRYGWSETRAAKWLEPVVHVWALAVPFVQAVAGLFLHIFNPVSFGNICYISPYPVLCGFFDDACTRGQSARLLYILFCIIPETILLAIIYVSIVLVYCAVRGQAQRALAITANRESLRARTKSVAVQSWLFAFTFFNTWFYRVLAALLLYTVKDAFVLSRADYVLEVLSSTFLPLQGFFNFFVYFRPRFTRLWKEHGSFWVALKLAVVGGRETSSSHQRRPTPHQRKNGGTVTFSITSEVQTSAPSTAAFETCDPIERPESRDNLNDADSGEQDLKVTAMDERCNLDHAIESVP
jgi:hypothetical protein